MTCHDARGLLSDLVDRALTPDEQRRVEAHLAGCADCRKEHERFLATVTLLQRMERPRAPVGFVDRVLRTIPGSESEGNPQLNRPSRVDLTQSTKVFSGQD